MNILLIGLPLFRPELEQLGHSVVTAGLSADRDMVLPRDRFSFREIAGRFGPAWRPDVCLLVEELGPRVFPAGVEECPCPLIFYSIDTHLNYFWLRHFASACDGVLTTQRDYVAPLSRLTGMAAWLPWGVDPGEFRDLGVERDLDIAFVGCVDEHRPRRRMLLEELSRRFNVAVYSPNEQKPWFTPDEISGVFSRARIVINEAISAEVNFRVFEAMAAGAMLLTERVGNGLQEMFEDGRHLVTFAPLEVVEKAAWSLEHAVERERIATEGKRLVLERHTRLARARELASLLERCERWPGRSSSSLGRTGFLLLRRGLLGSDEDLAATGEMLLNGCAEVEGKGTGLLNLAEFHAACGSVEKALPLYAASWREGERCFRLAAQWGTLLLDAGRVEDARAVLRLLMFLDFPQEVRDGLERALVGELPSPSLYIWLSRAAETTDDRFSPGFIPRQLGAVPLTGLDFIELGERRFPGHPPLIEERGDLNFRNGIHATAAADYLRALLAGSRDPRVWYDSALALAGSFRFKDALQQAEIALELKPDPDSLELSSRLRRLAASADAFQT